MKTPTSCQTCIAGSPFTVVLSIALTVVLSLAGCTPARNSESAVREMPIDSASVERGKLVYDAHCYSCHLQGQGGMAPALSNKPLPKFLIRFQVRHGMGSMPSFGEEQISDSELSDLVDYVVALRHYSH